MAIRKAEVGPSTSHLKRNSAAHRRRDPRRPGRHNHQRPPSKSYKSKRGFAQSKKRGTSVFRRARASVSSLASFSSAFAFCAARPRLMVQNDPIPFSPRANIAPRHFRHLEAHRSAHSGISTGGNSDMPPVRSRSWCRPARSRSECLHRLLTHTTGLKAKNLSLCHLPAEGAFRALYGRAEEQLSPSSG